MTQAEIQKTITDYDTLIDLVNALAKKLQDIDYAKYNNARGITDIEFGGDIVYVTCDDTCMGCSDYLSFSFPLEFLWLDDTTVEARVIADKIRRAELAHQKKEIANLERRSHELAEYIRLKAKFESNGE